MRRIPVYSVGLYLLIQQALAAYIDQQEPLITLTPYDPVRYCQCPADVEINGWTCYDSCSSCSSYSNNICCMADTCPGGCWGKSNTDVCVQQCNYYDIGQKYYSGCEICTCTRSIKSDVANQVELAKRQETRLTANLSVEYYNDRYTPAWWNCDVDAHCKDACECPTHIPSFQLHMVCWEKCADCVASGTFCCLNKGCRIGCMSGGLTEAGYCEHNCTYYKHGESYHENCKICTCTATSDTGGVNIDPNANTLEYNELSKSISKREYGDWNCVFDRECKDCDKGLSLVVDGELVGCEQGGCPQGYFCQNAMCCPRTECTSNDWTRWFDRDNPSWTGDWENVHELLKHYKDEMCSTIAAIEVLTVDGRSPESTDDVFYIYGPTGFVCRIKDQPDGRECEDYKIRFCCEEPVQFCECPADVEINGWVCYDSCSKCSSYSNNLCCTADTCPGGCWGKSNTEVCVHQCNYYDIGQKFYSGCEVCTCTRNRGYAVEKRQETQLTANRTIAYPDDVYSSASWNCLVDSHCKDACKCPTRIPSFQLLLCWENCADCVASGAFCCQDPSCGIGCLSGSLTEAGYCEHNCTYYQHGESYHENCEICTCTAASDIKIDPIIYTREYESSKSISKREYGDWNCVFDSECKACDNGLPLVVDGVQVGCEVVKCAQGYFCQNGMCCPLTDEPEDSCCLQPDYGDCRNGIEKWYYDCLEGVCKTFKYSGCGGNTNRFDSTKDCIMHCAADSCCLDPDPGPCEGYFPMWYFDPRDNTCKEFIYGGCHGNDNRYTSRQECESACRGFNKNITCEADRMTATISLEWLHEILPNAVKGPQSYHLNDDVCVGRWRYVGGKEYYAFTTDLEACGTTSYEKPQENRIVYTNVVRTHRGTKLFELECCYETEYTIAPIHIVTNPCCILVTLKGFGTFNITATLYRNDSFTTIFNENEFPLMICDGVFICFGIRVELHDPSLELFVEGCYASESDDPHAVVQHYDMIDDGCLDEDTMIPYGTSDDLEVHFCWDAYDVVNRDDVEDGEEINLYIHCKVVVCKKHELGTRCSQGCVKRKRRAIGDVPADDHSTTAIITHGPVKKSKNCQG